MKYVTTLIILTLVMVFSHTQGQNFQQTFFVQSQGGTALTITGNYSHCSSVGQTAATVSSSNSSFDGNFGFLVVDSSKLVLSTDGQPAEGLSSENSLEISPNPTSGNVKVGFDLSAPDQVSLSVLDLSGKTVYASPASFMQTGPHKVNMDLTTLSAGTYVIVLTLQKGAKQFGKLRITQD